MPKTAILTIFIADALILVRERQQTFESPFKFTPFIEVSFLHGKESLARLEKELGADLMKELIVKHSNVGS